MTAVLDELAALGAFYGTPVDAVIETHRAALGRYAEWVLGRDSFAIVTLGDVETLAPLGAPTAAARFRAAAERWPEAITGIKLDPAGGEQPTLYIRPVCTWEEGIAWLGDAASELPPARTLYGLGFQGEVVKIYVLAPDGFVSWRLDRHGLRHERKDYRAEVAWNTIAWQDSRWEALGALGRRLGFRTAGHLGTTIDGETKIYVERIGGIPTDRTLA